MQALSAKAAFNLEAAIGADHHPRSDPPRRDPGERVWAAAGIYAFLQGGRCADLHRNKVPPSPLVYFHLGY